MKYAGAASSFRERYSLGSATNASIRYAKPASISVHNAEFTCAHIARLPAINASNVSAINASASVIDPN